MQLTQQAGFRLTEAPSLLKGRELIAYGASLCLLQMQAIGYTFQYAVDDTPGLAGKSVGGVPIFTSARFKENFKPKDLVVICASKPHSILTIAGRLNSLGFRRGEHYIDCMPLQFQSALRRLSRELAIDGTPDQFAFVRLLSLYSSVPNLSCAVGTWIMVELLKDSAKNADGAIAECGVYTGGNAFATLMSSEVARTSHYYLLDSFEGFPSQSEVDPASHIGDFRDVKLQNVRDMFSNFSNVSIVQGDFRDTIPKIRNDEFKLVYVDCDLYEPTAYLCEQMYNRLTKGGYMLFHDYWVPEVDPPHIETFKGVNKALNEFLGSEVDKLVVFPETTHAVLRRP